MNTSLLSTGKKKAKASRVFGDVVFTEGSLCYSPSPGPIKEVHEESGSSPTPTPTVLFENEPVSEKSTPVESNKENSAGNVLLAASPGVVGSQKEASLQSIRNSELSRLRASRSPQRRNLVQRTQEALNSATTSVNKSLNTKKPSVNQTLNATRQAKTSALNQRKNNSKTVRFQWDETNSRAKENYTKLEESRRQILAFQKQFASAHFKQQAAKNAIQRQQHIDQIDRNAKFNSEVYRDHQKSLKDEQAKNRKKSIDTRNKLRQNHRQGEEKLQALRREEDGAMFEVRSDLHRSKREHAKANADARRKSFQFRAGDARRIRDLRTKWEQDELNAEHESFELSRAAAKDVEAYKKQMQEDRRVSLNGRNREGRAQREAMQRQRQEEMIAEHKSYELKRAGEKDAEAYQKRMKEERRKSKEGRNKESARHALVMQELSSIAMEQEAESYMLKWLGENDAKAYVTRMAEERRKSLQLRGEMANQHRMYEDDQHQKAVVDALAEGKLQSECQKDVEAYKKSEAERSRKSLQYRAKEAKLQRLEADSQRQKQHALDHQNFELESLARMDVEEYIKDCKKRRRKSLASRAKEKRRQAEWKRQQEDKQLEARQLTSHFQSLDAHHVALAQQRERAQLAIDALRNAGCSISGNPFGDLLDM